MEFLKEFEKEYLEDSRVICLTPYDRDFPFIFVSIEDYLNSNFSWRADKFGSTPEEYIVTYEGEDSLIHLLREDELKELLKFLLEHQNVDIEFANRFLLLHFDYDLECEVNYYFYDYDVYDKESGRYLYRYEEEDLAEELMADYGTNLDELRSKYSCLKISVDTKCFFEDNWFDLELKDKKLKVWFLG